MRSKNVDVLEGACDRLYDRRGVVLPGMVALKISELLHQEALQASTIRHTALSAPTLTWSCGCIDCKPTPAVALAQAILDLP